MIFRLMSNVENLVVTTYIFCGVYIDAVFSIYKKSLFSGFRKSELQVLHILHVDYENYKAFFFISWVKGGMSCFRGNSKI